MTKKLSIILKLILAAVFALVWFVLVQAEYEIITKPELQNDFPIIKGIYAVCFLGFVLLAIAAAIIALLYSIKRGKNLSASGGKTKKGV